MVTSYPPSLNGIANYSAKLCKAMVNVNKNLQILVLSDAQQNITSNDKIKVIKVWRRNSLLCPLTIFRGILKWKTNVIWLQHDYWLYGRNIYSIAFPTLLLMIRLINRPVVVTMHSVIPRKELTKTFFKKHRIGGLVLVVFYRWFVWLYTKLIDLLSSAVIVHQEIAKNVLISDYGFNVKKTVVIPHGVERFDDNRSLDQEEAKKRLGFSNKYVLLLFGQIRRGKGIEYAIKAMQKILTAHSSSVLLIAGLYDPCLSPESTGYLEELFTLSESMRLNDAVVFVKNLPEENVATYFAAADICLLPYTEDEILAASGPLSMAMSFAKPIVATRVRRFTELLRDKENALLVPPANPESLAEAIITLLERPELRSKFSYSLRATIEKLSWERVANQALAIINRICGLARERG
jgi:glycosyltransferase involved in cell wall biosynthesis